MHIETFPGLFEAPVIPDLHGHEGRDVHGLGVLEAFETGTGAQVVRFRQNIAVFFTPGGVMHFGHNGFDFGP